MRILHPLNIQYHIVYLIHPPHVYSHNLRYATSNHYHSLLVPERGNLEGQLWSLVFLSGDRQEDQRSPQLLDLPSIFWEGEFKLPNECDQKRVHFDDAVSGKGAGDQF